MQIYFFQLKITSYIYNSDRKICENEHWQSSISLFRITGMHIKLQIQVNHDWSLIEFTFNLSLTSMTLIFFRVANFFVNAILSTIVYVSLQNLYHISISPIARMSLKMGAHQKFNLCITFRWPFWILGSLKFCPLLSKGMGTTFFLLVVEGKSVIKPTFGSNGLGITKFDPIIMSRKTIIVLIYLYMNFFYTYALITIFYL